MYFFIIVISCVRNIFYFTFTYNVVNILWCFLKKEDEVVPAISNFYNQNMGGVDLSDQVMYSYPFERKLKS